MEERYMTFTGLILNISRCIQKIKNAEMSTFGLKGKQVQCLFCLYSCKEGASLTRLCELCDEDKGAMSRTLKELSQKGLVFVEEKEAQKYKNPLKLTKKGEKISKNVADKISDMVKIGSDGISESDRKILYNSLSCIQENLAKLCEKYEVKNEQNFD